MTALSDLRAAVARADEVLGCGAMPCRFEATTGQTTNGRCVCLDHPRAGHVLAALYKAAKAVVEKPIHEERFVFTSKKGVLSEFAQNGPMIPRTYKPKSDSTKKGEFEFYDTTKVAEPRCEVTTKSNEEVRRSWEATLGLDNVLKTCWCFQCLDEPSMGINNPAMRRYINCPDCHQNDCPRAASHGNACSGSNELGQDGSAYK